MSLLPGVISRNWQLKVMALAMAVLLWTVPRFESQDSRVLNDIPVRVQLSDPLWVQIGEPSPPSISVSLSGSARDLIAIDVERPPIQVPISEVFREDTTVFLEHAWFRGSGREGVVVEDLRPERVELRFERNVPRDIPFSISVVGELPDSLSQSGPATIEPASTTVWGAESRLEQLTSVPLMALDLSQEGGAGPFVQPVDTTQLRGLDPIRREATVEVPTEPTATREFSGVVLTLPELASDPQLQARPASVTITLSGPASLVEAVDPEGLVATIPRGRPTLAPGEESYERVVVEGVPEWVTYRPDPDRIILLRPVGQ